jgi:hypothetical protein
MALGNSRNILVIRRAICETPQSKSDVERERPLNENKLISEIRVSHIGLAEDSSLLA